MTHSELEASSAPPAAISDTIEASFAPRAGELLSLPFDQYGRMRIVQNIANTLYTEIVGEGDGATGYQGRRLRILDVGGYPGVLGHFLSDEFYELSIIDVVPDDGSIPGYVQGSGMELPYEDASFDVVTALDTLEHIPAAGRDSFLAELSRVASRAVVLINPVQSIEADLAEETLNEYIQWILDARQEQLAEHREYGLPDFAGTVDKFRATGWHVGHFPVANIYNWLFMMVAKHYLISMRDDRASSFERTLDRFYNLTFSESDRAEPAYRGVIVAVRPGLERALERTASEYPPLAATDTSNTVRLELTQVLMSMLNLKVANHEDRLLREQMEHRDRHISGLEAKLAITDLQRDRAQSEMARLVAEMQAVQSRYQEQSALQEQQFALHEQEFARHREYISRLEDDLRNKDEHVIYLERLLQGIESGRVMRITRAISRFLGRQ